MSKPTTHNRSCRLHLVALACTMALPFCSAAQPNADSTSHTELVGALESAVEAVESLPTFDVTGLTVSSADFGDGKKPIVGTTRFRMQVSHSRKILRYVAEHRNQRPQPAMHVKAGDPQYSSVSIEEGSVQRNSMFVGAARDRGVSIVESFPSFDEAITSGGVPATGFWGLYHFPFNEGGLRNLYKWIEQISAGNATVTATPGAGTIRYVAQLDHDPGVRFDVLHWEFKLPKYLPTFSKVERAIREGRVETYSEQNVDYTIVDGHEVPNSIQSWSPRIKREPQGLRIGKTHRDTELKWLRIADDAIDAPPKHLTTLEQVRLFLDECPATVPLDLDGQ